ncbi:hypothetical protein SAMN00768000_0240 [Sulfobacillus thermosulfidooxidans DSM 9293]|uniref:Uncharacterized protein n=1 Tax=Sulfobacillus thermosulfidooxidans (strain DSM 9293 / VKM B-1269 / AT-1) TaxID=929705 RepID=A0A1W1W7J9_SULTA|nr:hypothetical protein [Sulfobacillus thermosulfidooxidans]SMC02030.1 hypothetical protein SAMN00768000_0240 [Sulfobacillus thermosulfidooxidans DSM 9293]
MRRVRTRWNALSLARKSTVVLMLLSALILVSSRLLPGFWPLRGWIIAVILTVIAFVLSFYPARRS